jgi:hypothetical protein
MEGSGAGAGDGVGYGADRIRMRIREAQKNTDPTGPDKDADPAPQHWKKIFTKLSISHSVEEKHTWRQVVQRSAHSSSSGGGSVN